MTLDGVIAIILCYFAKFGKPAVQHKRFRAHWTYRPK